MHEPWERLTTTVAAGLHRHFEKLSKPATSVNKTKGVAIGK